MEITDKPYFSTSEAAAILGVSVSTIQGLVESGVLLAWKTKGGHRRIPRDSVFAVQARSNVQDSAPHAESYEIKHSVETSPSPMDIMIVEDDEFMASIYQGALAKFSDSHRLRICDDGVSALLEVGKQPPDFIILDLDIPNVNGLEMLRSLQKYSFKRPIQVLIITGLEGDELTKNSSLLSSYTVVRKPITADFLNGYLACLFALRY